eukprot:COSAG05_NODE_18293_length_310_cov_1.227488_1_plen_30_part_01
MRQRTLLLLVSLLFKLTLCVAGLHFEQDSI